MAISNRASKVQRPTDQFNSSFASRVLGLTMLSASSLVGQIAAYFGAIVGAVVAFHKLSNSLPGTPPWIFGVLLSLPVLLALTIHTIPTLLAEWRKKRLTEIVGRLTPGYFSLVPRTDEQSFSRADNKHEDTFQWIDQQHGNVLYLTGLSGSGKSSLLEASVLPRLEHQGWKIIRLRGYQNAVQALHEKLVEPGFIWRGRISEEPDTLPLLDRACSHIRPNRLLIILDQFEEALILQERERLKPLQQLISSLRQSPIPNLVFLLVFRSDYIGLINHLNLPSLISGVNWIEIPPFTEPIAQEFMLGSKLEFDPNLLRRVLREAAEIEQSKGLIRPITLNLCGLVLARFASGIPRGFRPGGLVRGFLRESVSLPIVRDVAPRVLAEFITKSVARRPRTVSELAASTGQSEAVVNGCLLFLGNSDRAIVRPLDELQQTWEISHDFLVPLLDSILVHKAVLLWRRFSAGFPWAAASILFLVFYIYPSKAPEGPKFGQLAPLHRSDLSAYQAIDELYQQRKYDYYPQPFPKPRGGIEPVLKFSDLFGQLGLKMQESTQRAGQIVFHVAGDTGNTGDTKNPNSTIDVAQAMEREFYAEPKPSFLLLLGNIVFSFGESDYYYGQFYLPFLQYPTPILAIAGNHDGMVAPGVVNTPTLQAFLQNFASDHFHLASASQGLPRTAQIEPGVYFTFEAPFVRILALYSNILSDPGVIADERIGYSQLNFLRAAFQRIKSENFRGAVIIAVHHPPYTAAGSNHGSSIEMLSEIDSICKTVGVWPHAVLSGHMENYQRFTRKLSDGIEIPYLISGNGGHNVVRLTATDDEDQSNGARAGHLRVPQVILRTRRETVVLESYDDQKFGYLRISVDARQMRIEYKPVGELTIQPSGDEVIVDLASHKLVRQTRAAD